MVFGFEVSGGFLLQVQKLFRQKQLEIEDFSVYWDTECEMLGKLPINQIQVSHKVNLVANHWSITAQF